MTAREEFDCVEATGEPIKVLVVLGEYNDCLSKAWTTAEQEAYGNPIDDGSKEVSTP